MNSIVSIDRVLAIGLISLVVCCSEKKDDSPSDAVTSPDSTEVQQYNGKHHPAWGTPLVPVPSKPVGDPIYIAQEAIALTDVTASVGLPIDGQADAVSVVDFDDNGWPDLVAHADRGLTFYRNMGGTFKDYTDEVLHPHDPLRSEGGTAVAGDLNGDGNIDIYIASRSYPDKILYGDGYGHFELAPAGLGVPDNIHAQTPSLVDVDNDGDLDVYLAQGRRIDADDQDPPIENGFAGSPNILLINNGSAEFQDKTAAWNAEAGASSESFVALFADYDRDGDADGLVIRDFGTDHYLKNIGDRFEDVSESALGSHYTSLMGLAVGDYNGDGHLDIYATNDVADFLYRGDGKGHFENVYKESLEGGDPSAIKTGWGCTFIDLDNDGDQDVVTISSYERAEKVSIGTLPARLGSWVVLENLGNGRFTDVTEQSGLLAPVNGASLAVADFDLDGDADVIAALSPPLDLGIGPAPDTIARGVRVLRNDSARAAGNRFLELSLRSEGPNKFAIGAIIDIVAGKSRTSRIITAGDSFVSSSSLVQHFGLGSRTKADQVVISWPSGSKQVAHQVPMGYHRLSEFSGECCYPGSACETALPDCPVWTSASDPCLGAQYCDPCQMICDALATCGESRDACMAECATERPTAEETICTQLTNCNDIIDCLENHPHR